MPTIHIRFNVCSMRTITDNFYRVCSHKETRFEFIFLLVLIIQFPVESVILSSPQIATCSFRLGGCDTLHIEDNTFRYYLARKNIKKKCQSMVEIFEFFFVSFCFLCISIPSDVFILFSYLSNVGPPHFVFIISLFRYLIEIPPTTCHSFNATKYAFSSFLCFVFVICFFDCIASEWQISTASSF